MMFRNGRHGGPVLALAAWSLLIFGGAALANTPAVNVVSGTVSSVEGNQIVVNGATYSVNPQTPALQQLEQVHAGQQVQLVLNGPPGSATSQVVNINVQNGP